MMTPPPAVDIKLIVYVLMRGVSTGSFVNFERLDKDWKNPFQIIFEIILV